MPPNIAIIGAGLIGCSWAMVFARAGWQVALHDPHDATLAAAPERCAAGLTELARHDLCDDARAAAARIRVALSLADALAGAGFVQECGPEDRPTKRAIFAELDQCAQPDAILASSTSAIPCSVFSEGLAGAARCVVGHPVNPPHLVRVVEVSGAPWTSAATLERARAVYAEVGQAPVAVLREIEGFILNRLQGALLAEAFRLVQEGYVTPQDLDTTVAEGLGLRWSFLGPFATIELNAPGGIADYCARYGPFYARIASDPPPPTVFGSEAVAAITAAWGKPTDIPQKSAARDRKLAALAAHKRNPTP
jgi:3-hydroxyacyl-CoA dehydrogenase